MNFWILLHEYRGMFEMLRGFSFLRPLGSCSFFHNERPFRAFFWVRLHYGFRLNLCFDYFFTEIIWTWFCFDLSHFHLCL